MKKSFAYKITSKVKINQELLSKKNNLNHHFIIDFNREESYEKVLIKGKALHEVEIMTQSLVDFL